MKSLDPIRMLVLEDNETDRLLLQDAFSEVEAFNHEILFTETLEAGLILINETSFDVILLDLGLPDSSGIETFGQVRQAAPLAAVLVLTSLSDERTGIEAVKRGAQDYLIKGQMPSVLLLRSIRYAVERQRATTALKETQGRFRKLAKSLQSARETERTAISREIHDELGQLLTGLKMDLNWISRHIESPESVSNWAEISARTQDAEKLVGRSIASLQQIALELRPSALDQLGLAEAMRDEGRRFASRAGIALKFNLPQHLAGVRSEVATALFRIFQELLTNVARHARATSVDVRCGISDGHLIMEVCDDGIGIPGDALYRDSSIGLLGMSERAESVGGQLSIACMNGRGTRAVIKVPQGTD